MSKRPALPPHVEFVTLTVAGRTEDFAVCSACERDVEAEACERCGGDGFDGHNCGEDSCCCVYPEENEVCDACRGEGQHWRCPNCGYIAPARPLAGDAGSGTP